MTDSRAQCAIAMLWLHFVITSYTSKCNIDWCAHTGDTLIRRIYVNTLAAYSPDAQHQ